jgi:glycosyltransferase involved in cell wall biosynthesis
VGRLNVAIDVSSGLQAGAGIRRYVRELVRALGALPDAPTLLPFATRAPDAPNGSTPLGAGPIRRLPLGNRGWRLASLASLSARVPLAGVLPRADVVHGTAVVLPDCGSVPAVVTVHDLSYVHHPEFHTRLNRTALAWIGPRVTRRARFVIADSRATADDVVRLYGIPESRVRVVPLGYDAARFTPESSGDPSEVLARYGIRAPYLLHVGTWEPRKNLATLLEAFIALMARGLPHRLVLAGARGWHDRSFAARLAAAGLGDRVVAPGRIADADLPALYRAADVFVYPSWQEGFGLPVLEATACGTPVVCSTAASLVEIVGDAARTVPPADGSALAAAIGSVLSDPARRATMVAAGLERARRFTWFETARRTAAVYAEAVAS